MKLYHGSNVVIDKIDLAKSKTNKDFGCGFYLSENEQQAQDMAQYKSLTSGGNAIVTTFEFNENCMTDGSLNIKRFDEYSEDWAMFVLNNRKNSSRVQIHNFDIVYGPIANDRVGAQIRRWENGDIDFNTFLERIKYIKGVTFQYFFGTEKAISFLEKV